MNKLTGLVSLAQALDQALAHANGAPVALALKPAPAWPLPPTRKKPALFSRCPWCGLQVLQRLLRDHMDMACAHRGRALCAQGVIPLYTGPGGCKLCGAHAVPGEDYCYTCLGD
jgi:hypothetical protein